MFCSLAVDVENSSSRLFSGDSDGAEGGVIGFLSGWYDRYRRHFQQFADRVTPHSYARWGFFVFLLSLFLLRCYLVQGFYIVCYALFIYLLNIFIHFLTPKSDPDSDTPVLPQQQGDEFRPFERKLPEFKFWWSCVRATFWAMLATLIPALDVPVFWPILVLYFLILFAITMKKEITKWIKLGYVPWSRGKPTYA